MAGLALTKQNQKGGDPVRPRDYKGTGNTYKFSDTHHKDIPKRD